MRITKFHTIPLFVVGSIIFILSSHFTSAGIFFDTAEILRYQSGYTASTGASTRIDLRNIYGDCKTITSTGSRNSFISTKYQSGWTSFKDNGPSRLTIEDCIGWQYITGIGGGIDPNSGSLNLSRNLAMFVPANANFNSIDGSGNVYIIDNQNGYPYLSNRVVKYSSTGEYLLSIGDLMNVGDNNLSGTAAYFTTPQYVVADSTGNIYVADGGTAKVKKYSSTGAWLMTIGTTKGDSSLGGSTNQLYNPIYVGGFSGGSISIIDYFDFSDGYRPIYKVKKFSATTGAFEGEFGSMYGDNNLSHTSAELSFPIRAQVTPEGTMFVSDFGNNKLKKYSSTGAWILTLTGTTDYLDQIDMYDIHARTDIESNQNGLIFTTDCGTSCLKVYNTGGALVSQIGSYVESLTGTNNASGTGAIFQNNINQLPKILGFSGGLYVFNGVQAKKYATDGTWLLNIGYEYGMDYSSSDNQLSGENAYFFTTENNFPAVDSNGNFYIFGGSYIDNFVKVKKYSSTGAWIMDIGGAEGDNDLSGTSAQVSSSYYNISKIRVNASGSIYILAEQLKVYSSTGAWLLTIGDGLGGVPNSLSGRSAKLNNPSDFTLDNSGSVYIQDGYSFVKYSSTGAFIYRLGSYNTYGTNTLSQGSARMIEPKIAEIDTSNNIYITDSVGQTIKKYSSTGTYLMTIGSNNYLGGNDLSGSGARLLGPTGIYGGDRTNFEDQSGNFYFFGSNYSSGPTGLSTTCDASQMRKYSSTGGLLLRIGDMNNSKTNNNLSGTSAQFDASGCSSKGWAIDASRNIWLRGMNNIGGGTSFKQYSSTGGYLRTLGSSSAGDNELNGTLALFAGADGGMMIDNTGNLWIEDNFNNKLKKYSSTAIWQNTVYMPYRGSLLDKTTGTPYVRNISWPYNYYEKYSSTGSYIEQLGSSSAYVVQENNLSATSAIFPTAFFFIDKMVLDYDGNVWMSFDGKKIKKYSSTGEYLLTLGDGIMGSNNQFSGTGAGINPDSVFNGMIFDNESNIYIHGGGGGNRKLKKYSSTGAWVFDIDFDPCVNFPISIDENGEIRALNECTLLYETYDSGGTLDPGISQYRAIVDAGGSTYRDNLEYILGDGIELTGGTMIEKYSSTGILLWTLGQDALGINNLSGTSALFAVTNELIGIDEIAIDMDKNIYIPTYSDVSYEFGYPTGSGAKVIKKYSSTGAYIMTLGSGISGDNNLSGTGAEFEMTSFYIDKYNRLHMVDDTNQKLKTYTTDGVWLTTLGTGMNGDDELSGTGAGISFANASIFVRMDKAREFFYIYDQTNNKIKKYRP